MVVSRELPLTAPGNLVISWRPAPKQKKRSGARYIRSEVALLRSITFTNRDGIARSASVAATAGQDPDAMFHIALERLSRRQRADGPCAHQKWRERSGPRQQVATYEQLAFDARQRGLQVPSFLTFALSAYQQQGTTKQVPSSEAVQAVEDGSPSSAPRSRTSRATWPAKVSSSTSTGCCEGRSIVKYRALWRTRLQQGRDGGALAERTEGASSQHSITRLRLLRGPATRHGRGPACVSDCRSDVLLA